LFAVLEGSYSCLNEARSTLIDQDRLWQEWHENRTPGSFQQLNFQPLFHSPETNRLTCALESMPNLPSRNVHFHSPPSSGIFSNKQLAGFVFVGFFPIMLGGDFKDFFDVLFRN